MCCLLLPPSLDSGQIPEVLNCDGQVCLWGWGMKLEVIKDWAGVGWGGAHTETNTARVMRLAHCGEPRKTIKAWA